MNKKRVYYLVPIILFVVLVGFLVVGLRLNPRDVPSPLIGKPAPEFSLPSLADANKKISSKDFLGEPWLFNVWATWCVSCREEHPTLVEFSRQTGVKIIGLDWKDDSIKAREWLTVLGDPYSAVAVDVSGDTAIDWGVYGAPETYVVDKHGVIRHKQTGPVTPEIIQTQIIPLLQQLEQES